MTARDSTAGDTNAKAIRVQTSARNHELDGQRSAAEQIIDPPRWADSASDGCTIGDPGQLLGPQYNHTVRGRSGFRVVVGLVHRLRPPLRYGGFKSDCTIVSGGFFTKESSSTRTSSCTISGGRFGLCTSHDVEEEVFQALPWRQLKSPRPRSAKTDCTAAAASGSKRSVSMTERPESCKVLLKCLRPDLAAVQNHHAVTHVFHVCEKVR